MTRSHRITVQTFVLAAGFLMAFMVTLWPLINSSIPANELIVELISGAGLGLIAAVLPYIVFWLFTRELTNTKLFYLSGITLVALGAIGTIFLLSVSKDPVNAQAGIAYIYILVAQAATLGFLYTRIKK